MTTIDWVADGQKYALIGLSVSVTGPIDVMLHTVGVRVFSDLHFQFPDHWRTWLGSLRADEVSAYNLFIVATSDIGPPGVLDGENDRLMRLVWDYYLALLVATGMRPWDKPARLSGAREGDEIDVRSHADEETPVGTIITGQPSVTADSLLVAEKLALGLIDLKDPEHTGWSWHLIRVLTVYIDACKTADVMDRIHQFCRCIEGLLAASQGASTRRFKSRTELFVGPGHHNLMHSLYEMRSSVEHLHEKDYLHPFNRQVRLTVFKNEAIIAEIARRVLLRILGNQELRRHFASASSIESFWAMAEADRQAAWGRPFDPLEVVASLNPDHIPNSALGAE